MDATEVVSATISGKHSVLGRAQKAKSEHSEERDRHNQVRETRYCLTPGQSAATPTTVAAAVRSLGVGGT